MELTVDEVAEKLGISTRRVRALIKKGRFPGAVKFGWSWSIPRKSLAAYQPRPVGQPRKRQAEE